MDQEITYKITAKELREGILEEIKQQVKSEQRAKFNERIIDVETVAKIHGVHPHTVRAYAKTGDIKCEPRVDKAPIRFRLGYALEFDFEALERRLRNKNSKKL